MKRARLASSLFGGVETREALDFPFGDRTHSTGILSEIGTKLRDWAVGQAGAGCYSQAALSSNDSKTRYTLWK